MLETRKGLCGRTWEPGLFFILFFQTYGGHEFLLKNCHRKFLQDVSETNNPSAFFNSGRTKRHDSCWKFTPPGLFSCSSRNRNLGMVTARKRAPRNWNFKERSLQYLNEVDRNGARFPPSKLDQEMADHRASCPRETQFRLIERSPSARRNKFNSFINVPDTEEIWRF